MRMSFGRWTPAIPAEALAPQVGTTGNDLLGGGPGFDLIVGLSGDDSLSGAGGTDLLLGGTGDDTLSGDEGNDILIGGRDGDTYVIDTRTSGADRIIDNGNAPNINGYYSSGLDEVQLTNVASTDDALHNLGITRAGDDLILTYGNTLTGTSGSITVQNHFAGAQYALEAVHIAGGPLYHVALLTGDQYTYSVHSGPDEGGEDIVLGTEAGEEIYGGIGADILVGFGGADHFMFHDEQEANGAHDLILDFTQGQDVLDFTDIKVMTLADVTATDNVWGNAVVTTPYGTIELDGIATADLTEGDFLFA